MKIMLMAGALITLPAIIVALAALFFLGRSMMIPALVSLFINLIPFVVAGFLLKNSSDVTGH